MVASFVTSKEKINKIRIFCKADFTVGYIISFFLPSFVIF